MTRDELSHIPVDWGALITAARTVEGEAGGESDEGKLAVACVIMNRVRRQGWMGKTVKGVARMKRGRYAQFSCWNDGVNKVRILKKTTSQLARSGCIDAVLRALDVAGTADDPSKGACHYHAHAVSPRWSRGREPDVIIGGHRFFVGIA